jgi:hypothetical protein
VHPSLAAPLLTLKVHTQAAFIMLTSILCCYRCPRPTPQAAVSPSVATPATAAMWAPHLAVVRTVRGLLDALSKTLAGPQGSLIGAVDGAVQAAAGVLGGAPLGGAGNLGGLVNTALNLIGRIPGL